MKKTLIVLLSGLVALGMVVSAGGYVWFRSQIAPVSAGNTTTKVFVVESGEGVNSIGARLTQEGLIRSPLIFKLVITQKDLGKKIQAGSFRLTPAMDAYTIAQNLTKGSLDLWVTILEGWRREEIADVLSKTYTNQGVPFDAQKFLNLTVNEEGYLYPDTYLLPVNANEENVANILRRTFETKVTKGLEKEITDVITMASLIEREARSDTARAMVSGILWKRLDNNWPLQVDATLQYAKLRPTSTVVTDWWPDPLAIDKEINSPYNTYKNTGLPPGPICSPSLSSIRAALNPTQSEYWYYITGLDNQMHYGRTLDEHNANIAQYLR